MRGIGKPPAWRRIVEGDAEPQIARGGDRGRDTQSVRDLPGQPIAAMMTAKQGQYCRTVLRDRQHRRLAALVGHLRRQSADQGAGGTDTDDRAAGFEQHLGMLGQTVEPKSGVRYAMGQAMDLATGQRIGDPAGKDRALPCEGNQSRRRSYRHACPRRCTSIIEKYGTSSGVTASSGSTIWPAMVACCT